MEESSQKEVGPVTKSEKILAARKDKIFAWLKNPANFLLIALILFTIGIRLYYFSMTANQPTWWDEGDYLALGKEFAMPSAETPEWWDGFFQNRPIFLSLVFALFIKLNISEAIMRLCTAVLPSIILVIFMYLLGKSLFNKRVGLIAGFISSVYWVLQFYGMRFVTDTPSVMFALICVYFFWEYYITRGQPKGLYLAVLFGVLTFLTRFPHGLICLTILIFMLLTKKHKIVLERPVWIAGIIGILIILPYLLVMKAVSGSFFPALATYSTNAGSIYQTFAWLLFPYVPEFLGWLLTIFAIIGFISGALVIATSLDLFFKERNRNIDRHYFLFIWMAIQIYYYVFSIRSGNDRWMLLWMPPIFMYAGFALDYFAKYLDKFVKYAGVVLIILVLGFAGFANMTHTDQLVKMKIESYKDVQTTGLWLRENTPVNAKIMAASIVQNTYYAQRRTYDFYIGNEIGIWKSTTDVQGRKVDMAIDFIKNESELECKMVRIKPDYMVLHVWEPAFTPDFMFTYPQRYPEILEPVASFETQGQTSAVIYKFKSYPIINISKVNCTALYERHENLTGIALSVKAPARLIIPS